MSINIEQEMLDCFLKLNESEKEAVLQLIKTFIKSKEQSEIIKMDHFQSESQREELKVEVVRYATSLAKETKQETYW
jgi:hypothetical protein